MVEEFRSHMWGLKTKRQEKQNYGFVLIAMLQESAPSENWGSPERPQIHMLGAGMAQVVSDSSTTFQVDCGKQDSNDHTKHMYRNWNAGIYKWLLLMQDPSITCVYIYICLAVSLQWLHLQTVPLFASPARRALCVVGGTTAGSRNFAQLQHMNWSKGGCSKKKLEIDVAHPCSIEGGSGLWETMAATHSSSKHGNMFGCLTPVAALANGSPFC